MAARDKITSYVPPDLADALRRVAAVEDRSVSDIVEDAIANSFSNRGREAEQAALMVRFDMVLGRLKVIERSQETLIELLSHAARFSMSVAPEIDEEDLFNFNARGSERFSYVVDAIIERLSSRRGVWREHFARHVFPVTAAPSASGNGGEPAHEDASLQYQGIVE